MQRVFVMYGLKPGADVDRYARWSKTGDQTTTPFQPGVDGFEVCLFKGAEKGEPVYQIVEDIEVESCEAWQETVGARDGERGPGVGRVRRPREPGEDLR